MVAGWKLRELGFVRLCDSEVDITYKQQILEIASNNNCLWASPIAPLCSVVSTGRVTEPQHQNSKAHQSWGWRVPQVGICSGNAYLGQGLSQSLDCDMEHRGDYEKNTGPEAKAKSSVQTYVNMIKLSLRLRIKLILKLEKDSAWWVKDQTGPWSE